MIELWNNFLGIANYDDVPYYVYIMVSAFAIITCVTFICCVYRGICALFGKK